MAASTSSRESAVTTKRGLAPRRRCSALPTTRRVGDQEDPPGGTERQPAGDLSAEVGDQRVFCLRERGELHPGEIDQPGLAHRGEFYFDQPLNIDRVLDKVKTYIGAGQVFADGRRDTVSDGTEPRELIYIEDETTAPAAPSS